MIKFSSNDIFWILLFLYYSFGVEKTNTAGSLVNYTRFKTIMVKIYTRFQTKTAKKHTLWGGTYLYSLYRGVTPPGHNVNQLIPPSLPSLSRKCALNLLSVNGSVTLKGSFFGHCSRMCTLLLPIWRTVNEDIRLDITVQIFSVVP